MNYWYKLKASVFKSLRPAASYKKNTSFWLCVHECINAYVCAWVCITVCS